MVMRLCAKRPTNWRCPLLQVMQQVGRTAALAKHAAAASQRLVQQAALDSTAPAGGLCGAALAAPAFRLAGILPVAQPEPDVLPPTASREARVLQQLIG